MDSSRISHTSNNGGEDAENLLTLSLSIGSRSPPSSSPTPRYYTLEKQVPVSPSSLESISQPVIPILQVPPLIIYPNYEPHIPTGLNPNDNAVPREMVSHSGSRPSRARKSPSQSAQQIKTETVPQPFPWSTTQRATVHGLDYLLSHNITTISGQVHCKKCDKIYTIEYDLQQKFREISDFIRENKFCLHDRAPREWMSPTLPICESCGSSVKPVVRKKKSINWLFLLLGKMLGCCKLSELKYFCKHTKNHKTGAKDRVLYLTYMGLCKQLDPTGPFDI
ncbi:hypothetical protein HRI_003975400 [Hibiscus trionum]|uniref:DUF7086 domain-containing protein n=1 Tax=Hibiscus trionum TaxID=183268 RepID=A0A9W7IXU2_HIBTR|nr:hypothetical protein HRI_003975400 [Hibiscus trionum]